MSGIITLRPTPAPTHLPIHNGRTTERPHLEAAPAWCFVEAAFTSTWELPAARGLAISFWPRTRKGVVTWDLGVTHTATGRGLGLTRQGGAAIEFTPANMRRLWAAVADLLALGVDWADHDFSAHPDLGQRVRAVYDRHFPAVPEFRAWRLDEQGKPTCKWFKSNAAAASWAERCERWWMIERWTIPPRSRGQTPNFGVIIRGELPDGCASVRWSAWGVVREATPGQPAPAEPKGGAPTPAGLARLPPARDPRHLRRRRERHERPAAHLPEAVDRRGAPPQPGRAHRGRRPRSEIIRWIRPDSDPARSRR